MTYVNDIYMSCTYSCKKLILEDSLLFFSIFTSKIASGAGADAGGSGGNYLNFPRILKSGGKLPAPEPPASVPGRKKLKIRRRLSLRRTGRAGEAHAAPGRPWYQLRLCTNSPH